MVQRIAEWEHSKWLLLSSFLFLIPTVYGLYKELYVWSMMLFITTIISANYWRDACVGWRRDLDLWYAKLHRPKRKMGQYRRMSCLYIFITKI